MATLINSEDVSDPTEYKHMKILRFFLSLIGAWPDKAVGKSSPFGRSIFARTWCLMQQGIAVPMLIIYIYFHQGKDGSNLFKLGHTYLTLLFQITSLQRLTVPFREKYNQLFREFVQKFHLIHYKNESEYAKKTHLMVLKMSHLFTMLLTFQATTGALFFNIMPIWNNISSGVFKDGTGEKLYELGFYLYLPVDPERELKYYIPAIIYGALICSSCSIALCVLDAYLILLVFQIWGHLKILKHEMDSFPKPKKGNMFSTEELVQVNEKIKNLVHSHRHIMDFAGNTSDTFGGMLFGYLLFHQVTGCLLLLECSQMDAQALARYGPVTLIMFQQIIQISVIFELIGSKSEELIDAAYCLPWESMDPSGRKKVLHILMRMQKPLRLKALGMADVGVTSMARILKTSMSYFTLLRNS